MNVLGGGGGFLNPNGRRGGRGGGGPNHFMLFMLIGKIFEMGADTLPPVTLAVTGLCIAIALRVIPAFRVFQKSVHQCFNAIAFLRAPTGALGLNTLKHGIQSTFVHHNDYHLYYTMMAWLYKARAEERHRGSEFFLLWTVVAIIGTTITFIGMSTIVTLAVDPDSIGFVADWIDPNHCACGLTGVLFALKSGYQYGRRAPLPDDLQHEGDHHLRGGGWWLWNPWAFVPQSLKNNVWCEIIVVECLASRVSFLWHVSGVLCGIAMSQWGIDDWLRGPAGSLRRARVALLLHLREQQQQQQRR
jgi:membrane associated rhomboid family serine protease